MNDEVLFKTVSGITPNSSTVYYPNYQVDKNYNKINDILDVSAWEKQACPLCGYLSWTKIHRTWLEKVLHPNKNKCVCRGCKQEFWR